MHVSETAPFPSQLFPPRRLPATQSALYIARSPLSSSSTSSAALSSSVLHHVMSVSHPTPKKLPTYLLLPKEIYGGAKKKIIGKDRAKGGEKLEAAPQNHPLCLDCFWRRLQRTPRRETQHKTRSLISTRRF